MANNIRGQIPVDFKGEQIKLRLSINAICDLEERVGQGIGEFLDRFEPGKSPAMRELRLLFWALMLEEKPSATLRDAGEVIEGLCGDHERVMTEAILAAFPEPSEGAAPEK